jgi:hypothetical protein
MMSRSVGPSSGPGTFSRSFAVGGPSNNRFSMMGHDRDHDRDFGRRFDRDHDFDRDRDRFRFRRFFPTIAFGFNTYSDDSYNDDCFVLQRVWTRHGLRLRRIWVCD